MDCVVATGTVMPLRVNEPAPPLSTTSPGTVVVLTRIGPATPVAPWWMCAMFTTDVDGRLCTFTWKLTVDAVMTLLASRVIVKSIVAVPVPVDSALLMGGVSCDAASAAVKRTFDVPGPLVEGDVVVELELEQPAARITPTLA